MSGRRTRAAFTLPELITVVAVIGVLASIAIPDFIRYQLEAKTAEAQLYLHAIAHRARVADKEGLRLVACGPSPQEVPGPEAVPFEAADCWRDLGFRPKTKVWHQLELEVQPEGGFVVWARSDLDGDGHFAEHRLDSERDEVVRVSVRGTW